MAHSRTQPARVGAAALAALAVVGVSYVGCHALQEDMTMRPGSPLAWLLVDSALWKLEPPLACAVQQYGSTVGDGPKLPGSDVTLRCDLEPAAAEAWARAWLTSEGFEPAERPEWLPARKDPTDRWRRGGQVATVLTLPQDSGVVHLRISISLPD